MSNAKDDLHRDSPYAQTDIHRRMLRDAERVRSFKRALERAVNKGDTVLDAGTGTGILAMLAARTGAGKVYALEPTPIIEVARRLVFENGMIDRIELIPSRIEAAVPPARVDLVMWEWIGVFGIDEGLLPLFLLARDTWLKPGGRLIPEGISIWMAPAFDIELAREHDYWRDRPYGLNYSFLWDRMSEEWQYGRHHIGPGHLAAEPACLWSYDLYKMTREEACAPQRASVEFKLARAGVVNCLALWFDSTLSGDVKLSNAPDAPPTHWGRMAFPFRKPYSGKAGETLRVEFLFQADGTGPFEQSCATHGKRCELTVQVGDADEERHFDNASD